MDTGTLYGIAFALIFTGVLVVILTLLFLLSKSRGEERTRGAGVIVIGPVPIVIGTDGEMAETVLLLSIMTTALVIVTMIVYWLETL